MPQIDLVDNMMKPPGRCGICNTTPHDDEGNPLPAIDTHVDVDWGNNFYICDECADVICDLKGRVTPEELQKLRADYLQLKRDHKRLRTRFREQSDNLKRILAGKRAEGKARKAA